jgi:FAD/FMN-containing dehydrogenase
VFIITMLSLVWLASLALVQSSNVPTNALTRLATRLQGYVMLPSARNFSKVSRQWNARFDTYKPSAAIYCASERDVLLSVELLNAYAACYTVRSAGHSFTGWAVKDTCIIVDVSMMSDTAYDNSTEFLTVGPGTNFWQVTIALGKVNRTTTHGFGPTVAFGGYTQGGGVGLTHRKYGLAIDNLQSARVVLTNGSIVCANASSHADLFWALRGGGGGNWGVVTAFSFKTYDASAPVLYAMIQWKFSHALVNETGHIWQQYFVNNSDVDFGFYWRINGNPVLGELGTSIQIYGIYTGDMAAGRNVIEEFVKLFPTGPHHFEVTPTSIDAAYQRFMQPFRSVPHTGFHLQSRLISRPMGDEAFTVLAEKLDDLHFLQQFVLIWMDPLGGKVAEIADNATAFPWRDAFANFAIFAFYLEHDEQEKSAAWMQDTWTKLSSSMGENKVYVNFCFENVTDWQSAYFGKNYPRLQEVKSKYDPSLRMTFPQSIEPANKSIKIIV